MDEKNECFLSNFPAERLQILFNSPDLRFHGCKRCELIKYMNFNILTKFIALSWIINYFTTAIYELDDVCNLYRHHSQHLNEISYHRRNILNISQCKSSK